MSQDTCSAEAQAAKALPEGARPLGVGTGQQANQTADPARPSYAAQHANPTKGFNVVPRWFRVSPFWQSLKLEHRAILDELFHMVRRLPEKWKDQIEVGRGQFVMTQNAVAERCGATREQVRLVLDKAEQAGILNQQHLTWTDKGKTNRITLATWRDFEAYDRPQEWKDQSKAQSGTQSPTQSNAQSKNHNNTEGETPVQTEKQDREERLGAASPPAACVGSPSQAAGVDAPTQPARGPTKPLASKREKLEPEDVARICSDLDSMLRYLLHGKTAVYDPTGQYPPGPLNWRRYRKGENDLGLGEWDARTFAGFYWANVSSYRSTRGIALTLPPIPKLIGHMSNLLKQMPPARLHQIVTFVVYYFDLIIRMAGNAGSTLFLDADSLVNGIVQRAANNLMEMTPEQRDEVITRYGLRAAA